MTPDEEVFAKVAALAETTARLAVRIVALQQAVKHGDRHGYSRETVLGTAKMFEEYIDAGLAPAELL